MSRHTVEQLIAEVDKNASEVIRVQRTRFRGIDLVDCRVWTVPAIPGAESKPTKKGLTLRSETWAELIAALREALGSELEEAGDGDCDDADSDFLGGDV
jgi:hypothetical protein